MTSSEMHTHFKLELDNTSSFSVPAFEPEEIDLWLNKGVSKFVKTRYSGLNTHRDAFEQTQKRIDDLRSLVLETTLDYGVDLNDGVADTNKPNSVIGVLPTDYLFTLSEEVTISYNDIRDDAGTYRTKRVGVTEATSDNYRAKMDDPYSEHRLHYENAKPLRLYYASGIELITDGNYDITKYHLRYLRQPATIELNSVDCDLPEHTHDEIVKIAVSMALENIEQPRYQSHMNEVNTME